MKRFFAASVAALLMVSLVSSVALAAPKATSLWSLYNINAGGTSYTPKAAPGTVSSVANFAFPSTATAALLTTSKDGTLLGDLTGKTITATFTITGTNPTFIYGGEPDGSGAGSTARLFFQSNNGKFAYTNYWWSAGTYYKFVDGATTATMTLIVPLATGNWSDWNGKTDTEFALAFAQAVTNVGQIGLSFGGGYFAANGVGVSPGTASFSLTSYTVG